MRFLLLCASVLVVSIGDRVLQLYCGMQASGLHCRACLPDAAWVERSLVAQSERLMAFCGCAELRAAGAELYQVLALPGR